MDSDAGRMFVYQPAGATRDRFVDFRADRYRSPNEERYTNNIAGPHTPDTLLELFRWKIGARFLKKHLPKVEQHFIPRIEDARQQPADVTAEDFLKAFPSGGAIYRIFWIHCWRPTRFPIYDQHVHRAMTYILDGRRKELPGSSPARVVRLYTQRYLRFWASFEGQDPRRLDMALWAFGKYIKSPKFPIS